MIVGGRFEGDQATNVMWAQHDIYHDALGVIVETVQSRWREAEVILGTKTMTGQALAREWRDHRVLQGAHDTLAAVWRWQANLLEPVLPFDAPTLPRLMSEWLGWLRAYMASCPPELIGDLGRAMSFENSELGGKAEDMAETRLAELLNKTISDHV